MTQNETGPTKIPLTSFTCAISTKAFATWNKLATQCYTHIRPGGYVEWSSIYLSPRTHGGFPPDAALLKLEKALQQQSGIMGWDLECPTRFKNLVESAGFRDVEEHVYQVPSSDWSADERMKEIGAFEYYSLVEKRGAISSVIYDYEKHSGQSLTDLEMMGLRLKHELRTNNHSSYML